MSVDVTSPSTNAPPTTGDPTATLPTTDTRTRGTDADDNGPTLPSHQLLDMFVGKRSSAHRRYALRFTDSVQHIAGLIKIMVSDRTTARLDRARHYLDCPQRAEYSEVIVALLNEANVRENMEDFDDE